MHMNIQPTQPIKTEHYAWQQLIYGLQTSIPAVAISA